jgi:hypothetical protein
LECPKGSLLIVGRNLLPAFGFNFAKCSTFHTNKLQHITLSRTVRSKDCTATSRTRFAHAPPRQHSPSNYPLYSSDSEHRRGKTLIFPRLRQVLVLKLFCPMNFCTMMNFQLTPLTKIFPKPCMFLPLLCLGAVLVPPCPASYQLSCSPPPLSRSIGAPWFHPFSHSTTAPAQSCTMAPSPSPSELGHGMRWSPSAALRLAWPRMPCLAPCVIMAERRARVQAVLSQPSGSRFQTRWFLLLPLFRCHYATVPELFSYPARRFFVHPGPAVPSQPPQTRYPSHQQAPPQRLDL